MRIEIKTKTGVTYVLDRDQMTWACTQKFSAPCTAKGILKKWPIVIIDGDVQYFDVGHLNGEILSWHELDAIQTVER